MEDCPLATAWRLPDVEEAPPAARPLRVALFSGNYNYVRDGSNQALNRLVAFLEREGCTVRVYSPTSDTPAFPPAGTLISVPSVRIPFRGEYRVSRGLPDRVKRDIEAFAPDIIHLSTPDPLNHSAKALGKALGIPVVASFHTRFDTYFRYYGLAWFDTVAKRIMRSFYDGLDEVFVTSAGFGDVLKADGIIDHAAVWSRGVDKLRFNPAKRDMAWRRSIGIADDDVVIGFVGRLVLEKGLDVVAAAAAELKRRGVAHKLLIVGEGPARAGFEAQVPDAIFTGFLEGEQLARAYASADMLLNPSITETFGNINLEAMASGIPIVAAVATGSNCLIDDGVNGRLVPAGDIPGFADALAGYLTDPAARKAAGAEGLRRAGGYNWDAINGAVLARYRELVGA
jgi:glycosyltransferase involved in cell wall biosynthesis